MPRAVKSRTSLPGHSKAARKQVQPVDEDSFMPAAGGADTEMTGVDEPQVEEPEEKVEEPAAVRPPKQKKADKAYAKREALIAKITAGQNPYSKSHNRRLKRAAKPENNLVASLNEVKEVLHQVESDEDEAEESDRAEEVVKAKEGGGKGKEKLTAKKRQRVLSAEATRMPAILSNPAFASDPFATIRLHTMNTLQTATHAKPKAKKGKK
ncbi:hypothetical protein MNV49_000972 [Pseudohyphozyma bogoriensis]|nr:hypothetical protein MNV49_000972 [Pseudohyphozyma bogoriensis]